MKHSRKMLALLVVLSMLTMLLAGCTGSTPAAAPTAAPAAEETAAAEAPEATEAPLEPDKEYKDELHIAMGSEPTNLDVTTNTATVATEVAYGTIFEALVAMDESYGPVAELAESWEISDDSTEYTWHLRQGVKFHNGEEMTAEDAAASLNRWLASAGNAQTMIGEATFEAADTYTVTLKMQQPCAYVNELMAGLGQRAVVMPKSVLDALDETGIVTEYIGTGPYKFVEWAEHQYIHITRNDDYQPYGTEGEFNGWSGYKTAATRDIYFDIVTDAATVVAGMQTYIEAMRVSGARTGRILLGHIAPNILSPVIVQVSFVFASAIITEAALNFLGVGVPVPEPSWGNILNEGMEVIYKAWWMILFPGLFPALSVLGLNILGDGLRDFLDPHSN